MSGLDELTAAVEAMKPAADAGELSRSLFDMLSDSFGSGMSGALLLCGAIILGAALEAISGLCGERSELRAPLDFIASLSCALIIYSSLIPVFELVNDSILALCTISSSTLPILAALYAAGGQTAAAAANTAAMSAIITFMEQLAAYALTPVLNVCFGLAIASAAAPGEQSALLGISTLLRRFFTGALAFVMSMLTIILAYQTLLTQSADSLAVRTVRYALSSAIPVVGGSIGECLRTLLDSISAIRSAAGMYGIAAIVLSALPCVLKLASAALGLTVAKYAATLLERSRERALLEEAHGLISYCTALLGSCAILMIFDLTLLIKAAVSV